MTDGLEQALLRSVLDSPRDIVIFALDDRYRYLAFNENHRRTMRAIWGVDIEVGRSMLAYIARSDDRQKAKQNFDRALAGESFTVIEEYGDENINRRYYEDVYSPILDGQGRVMGLTLYLTDITEQRMAELELEGYRRHLEELVQQRTRELEAAHAQLLHGQKLESLGVLAGGIAHDFNNLLAVILGCADIALRSTGECNKMVQQLEHIRCAAERANVLTDQLLAYSGRGKMVTKPLAINELVREMADLLRVTLPRSVTLSCDLDAGLPTVEGDPAQLQQVVMNLISNAAEAITSGTGHVLVRTTRYRADREKLDRAYGNEALADGEYVCLEVKDDGRGMDESVRHMIFDPFFTTKFSGRGLGLAAVHGIVRAHGGGILVDSQPGLGSRFRVLFPPSSKAVQTDVEPRPQQTPSFNGDRLVMLVDDDDRVRDVLTQMLATLGLRVIAASDGRQACEMARGRAQDIAVVLLDLTMPGMSGAETLVGLREIRPDIPVIILSGYTQDEASLQGILAHVSAFLHKPVRLRDLSTAISNVLNAPQSAAKT